MHYLWLTLLESMEAICNCCCATLCRWTAHLHETAQVARHLWCFDAKHFADLAVMVHPTYEPLHTPSVLYVDDCMIVPSFAKWLFGGTQWFRRMSYTQVMNQSVALKQLTSIFVIWRWVEKCIQNVARMTESDVITHCSISPTWSSSHLFKSLIKSQSPSDGVNEVAIESPPNEKVSLNHASEKWHRKIKTVLSGYFPLASLWDVK